MGNTKLVIYVEYAPPRLVFEREELAWTSVLVQSTSHKVRYLTVRHSTRNTLSVLVRVLASLIRPSPPPVRRGKNRQERQEQEQHLLQPFEAIRSHLQAKRPSGQAGRTQTSPARDQTSQASQGLLPSRIVGLLFRSFCSRFCNRNRPYDCWYYTALYS